MIQGYTPTKYTEAEKDRLPCPVCGKETTSLKGYTLYERLVFLIILVSHKTNFYTACPHCMRKIIVRKTFNSTIVTGWILWLVLILPWHALAYLFTFSPGLSRSIIVRSDPTRGWKLFWRNFLIIAGMLFVLLLVVLGVIEQAKLR